MAEQIVVTEVGLKSNEGRIENGIELLALVVPRFDDLASVSETQRKEARRIRPVRSIRMAL